MDPLKGLIANVPDWLRRLDELNGQIEQRQLDLAKLQDNQTPKSSRSLKHRGSTESLKPKDDGAAFSSTVDARQRDSIPPPPLQIHDKINGETPSSPVNDNRTPSVVQRKTKEVMAIAQKRARATLQKRQKTESMMSSEAPTPTYRSWSMIIVYYDSYVQSFFEELVKFVSASRNLMRKAKMAAKVAQIKRLAELEMPDDDDEEDKDNNGPLQPATSLSADPRLSPNNATNGAGAELKIRYMGARQLGQFRRPGAFGASPLSTSLSLFNQGGSGDVYDELDRGLEFVQGMCERAAHQFLRDGECTEEIDKIKKRLKETKEKADAEMERLLKENPDGLSEPEPIRTRSYRPMSMRRELGASSHSKKCSRLEVDDEGISDMDDFKPAFKATTLMDSPTQDG